MIREGGTAALSLREATRRAGVTPGAAYRHFRGRDDLLAAASRAIQEQMTARMRTAVPPRPAGEVSVAEDAAARALDRLRGVGLGYIGFARAEPGWFETVFFGAPGVGAETGAGEGAGEERDHEVAPPFLALLAALDECRDTGVLTTERREGAEFVCWSAVHGFAELVIHGPLRDAPAEVVDALSVRVVDDIIAGVR